MTIILSWISQQIVTFIIDGVAAEHALGEVLDRLSIDRLV